ncbi:unnamed protein product [Acanthoscelides obtectus]|uniref:Regulator of G-protein signaling loco n=1 Tax=Acanthoscelides obtectus TaxID=200917 RepID=A0A9P0M6B7_ACAOB|nr:unnamed protein product [Acanthoscelides obtectus]CAK1656610.1 Regulator of G-protein signaling loco [Acanthoscelides obtectus]
MLVYLEVAEVSLLLFQCDQNGVAKCTSAEGPSAWANSFEKLLEDPLGLHTFAEFLKKEFSAENIYFWCACERYRRLPTIDRSGTPTGGGTGSGGEGTGTAPSSAAPNCERLQEAQRIYSQHLAQGAQEAVNVDAHGRQCAEQGLQDPDNTIFDQAQKQIFNLMKFDSYPRYLRSDIYRRCVSGEVDRAPLDARLQLQPTAPLQATTPPAKLKKSVSNAEDRRRKSLLPWHRKNRSKSKDRGEIEYAQKQECTGVENEIRRNGRSEMHSSGSSLTSLDLAISNQDTSKTGQNNREDSSGNGRSALCKVNLSNGSTTVVQIRESETIQELVNRLLEKRGLNYSSYEVYTDKHGKPQDITAPSSTLSGREVLVERRVTLKLDLPNRKTVTVKSRGCKQLSEVLRSTLHKYQYQMDKVTVVDADGRPLDLRLSVSEVDGMRVGVRVKDDVKQDNSIPVLKVNNVKVNKLEEITNKVFEGILQEKADSATFKHSKSDRGSVKSEDWGSEHSSTFIGKFLRRDSGIHDRKKKLASRCKGNGNEEVSGDQNHSKKPLIAKLKAGANKLHVTSSESDELVEGLTRAQRRLEDQRGTEINFELPDFLKDKENNSSQTIANKPSQNNTRFYLGNNSRTEEVSNYENRNIVMQNSNTSDTDRMPPPAPTGQPPPSNVSSRQTETSISLHGLDTSTVKAPSRQANDPPPLPPKPKIVPIRPPNWGHLNGFYKAKDGAMIATPGVPIQEHHRTQAMFLEQSSSSFV